MPEELNNLNELIEKDQEIINNFKALVEKHAIQRLLFIFLVCGAILIINAHLLYDSELKFFIVPSISILVIMILATVVESIISRILKKLSADTAFATKTFATTMHEVFGLIIYLSIVTFAFLVR